MADNLLGAIFSAGNKARRRVKNALMRPEDFAAEVGADLGDMDRMLQSGDPDQILQVAGPGSVLGTVAGRSVAPIVERLGGTQKRSMLRNALSSEASMKDYVTPTVENPQQIAFPDIYLRPDQLVSQVRAAPEDPLMKQLFGVTRDDLYGMAQEGRRVGNAPDRPFKAAANPRGAKVAPSVMNRANEQRLLDIIDETRKRPEIYKGMASWYTMDPAYQRLVQLVGPEQAPEYYRRFNTYTGMASPNSDVMTELNRGTAANWLARQGKFDLFDQHAGLSKTKRGPDYPSELSAVLGHMTHSTAQAPAMRKFTQGGVIDMDSPKVPSYIAASSVPEVGFQTQWPVGDAHWSRLVGLPDVRNLVRDRQSGMMVPNAASAETPEMVSLAPWWRDKIASKAGLEAVPAQAVVWGGGSKATGVDSPIGAPKLEMLSTQIGKAAKRLGVSPETARDMILMGQQHAGFITPKQAALLAGAAGAGTYVANSLMRPKEKVETATKDRNKRMRDVDAAVYGSQDAK